MAAQSMGHFKDELRKSLIVHALIPILLVTFALLTAVFVLWGRSVVAQNEACAKAVSSEITDAVGYYTENCAAIAAACDPERLRRDTAYHSAWNARLYSIVNRASHSADFYILDGARRVVSSKTLGTPAFVAQNESMLWGSLREMHNAPDKVTAMLSSSAGNLNAAQIEIGKAILNDRSEIMGYIVFVISSDNFLRGISNLPVQVVVTDAFNHVFLATNYQFHTPDSKADERLQNTSGYLRTSNEQYYISRDNAADGLAAIYAISSLDAVVAIFLGIVCVLSVVFTVIGCTIFFVSSKRIAARKTRIIDELVAAFHSVQEDSLSARLHISSNDEFQTIGDAYNRMLDHIETLIQKNNEQTRATVLAEIKQLESQFAPHFLFNTLETIRFMVNLHPDAADRMIVNLSNLLRYSIQNDKNEVIFGEEIEYIQNYLAILNCRFQNRFNYVIDISEEAEACVIPKLIFQPVIENSVKYGFSDQNSIIVRLTAEVQGETLLVTVQDNGAGMDEATLGEVRAILGQSDNPTKHIGLFNVHRRIRLMYGDSAGITIASHPGAGTTVRFSLPIQ